LFDIIYFVVLGRFTMTADICILHYYTLLLAEVNFYKLLFLTTCKKSAIIAG